LGFGVYIFFLRFLGVLKKISSYSQHICTITFEGWKFVNQTDERIRQIELVAVFTDMSFL
jgi:hypothetical protein